MPLLLQKLIHRTDLRNNPAVIYLFGDNELRVGLGGQADAMRGEPNAHGIATLLAPGRFWHETDFERQCKILERDFTFPMQKLAEGRLIVYPTDGVGTGLAALEKNAPSTFAHLQLLVGKMKEFR